MRQKGPDYINVKFAHLFPHFIIRSQPCSYNFVKSIKQKGKVAFLKLITFDSDADTKHSYTGLAIEDADTGPMNTLIQ